MKRMAVRWLILIGVVLLVTSCTGVSMSRLQNDFDRLYQEKEDCRQSADARNTLDITRIESIPCLEESEAALFNLAQSAKSAAEDASDQRTKVALLRLAGVSLWQSGRGTQGEGNALVNQITSEGESICDSLETEARKENIFGAPRDCAILTILPALVWHSEYFNRLEQLAKKEPTEDRKKTLEGIISNYPNNTVLFIVAKETKAKGFTGLSDSVKVYIEEVKKRSFCNYLKTEEIVLEPDNTLYLDLKPEVKRNIEFMSEKAGIKRSSCQ